MRARRFAGARILHPCCSYLMIGRLLITLDTLIAARVLLDKVESVPGLAHGDDISGREVPREDPLCERRSGRAPSLTSVPFEMSTRFA